jgi:hypothetical protein
MKAYHYDEYRFYDGAILCQKDPLESEKAGHDIYLAPADTTSIKPEIIKGSTPRWNGESWEQYYDDKIVYGYTANDDGTINYYGSNHIAEELQKIHSDVVLSFSDTEPVSVNGIYWLSADDPAYIEAKAEADKEQALDDLDAQYNADKDELLKAYQTAVVYGDTDLMASLRADLEALDEQYDADYEELVGEE